MTEAYPLTWPKGWPRTQYRAFTGSRFGNDLGVAKAANGLYSELERLGAENAVLSTNMQAKLGRTIDGRGLIGDPGAAIYFSYNGEQMVMAQDNWDTVAGNVRSLAKAIEYMRGLERHGGAHMMVRAFNGFSALPPPENFKEEIVDWKSELGPLPEGLEKSDLLVLAESRYRQKAKAAHSDTSGGDDTAMIRLNAAITLARQECAA